MEAVITTKTKVTLGICSAFAVVGFVWVASARFTTLENKVDFQIAQMQEVKEIIKELVRRDSQVSSR